MPLTMILSHDICVRSYHGGAVTDTYTPSDIEALGVPLSPDNLRDWRRRGMLDNFGRVDAVGRWTYRKGDVVALAAAKLIEGLGVDLSRAIEIADKTRVLIVDGLRGKEPEYRFIAAWPVETGQANMSGIPAGRLESIQLNDLNRISEYVGIGASVIDIEKIVQAMPDGVKALFGDAG